jgi:hypothetical protein
MSSRDKLSRRLIRWIRSVLFYEYWMVGIVDQPISNALHWKEMPPVRWIAPFDRARYFADPFPWPGSADTLLCEEYDTKTRLGRISALKLDANGIAVEVLVDFPLKGHLSFPLLFMHAGIVYAMPESSASNRLEILRWKEETGIWISHAVIFENKGVADAALYDHDGLFWISYTDLSTGPHDNLHLIYAPSLEGPWLRHPGNPVRRGREASRNGGCVFEVGGRLYRPAQDCTQLYGGALQIMEITEWTTTAYQERPVTRIVPSAPTYPDGFHTLSAWGDRCLVDGMRLTFSFSLVFDKFKKRLGF